MKSQPVTVLTERRAFFTPRTLAEFLALSERTVRAMLADGVIASYRIAGSRRIAPGDVDAYLSRCRDPRTLGTPIERAGDAANVPAPAPKE